MKIPLLQKCQSAIFHEPSLSLTLSTMKNRTAIKQHNKSGGDDDDDDDDAHSTGESERRSERED